MPPGTVGQSCGAEMSTFVLYRRSRRVPFRSSTESPTGDPLILPTLLGAGYGLYGIRKSTFLLSFLAHVLASVLFLALSSYLVTHRHEVSQHIMQVVTDVSPYVLPPSGTKVGGGGGGGDRDKLAASKGTLPKLSLQQLAPPASLIRNENPKLPVVPTVVVPPDIHLPFPRAGLLGDPRPSIIAPPSNGVGSGGGIGSGSGGGGGSGSGPGVGPGSGGGMGGGVYRVGGGVTAPRIIYGPDPEFSEEARKAKYQAVVFYGS